MNPALHTPTLRQHRPLTRGASRGFTLIELMTVVVIIGIFSAIALPSVVNQLRERKSANVAQQLTQFYRTARMRAAGRGSAVLVRYDKGTMISMREAIAGAASANHCTMTPIASCTTPSTRWDDASPLKAVIDQFNPFNNTAGTEYELTRMDLRNGTNAVRTTVDICFTPGGRAFYRDNFASAFTTLDFVPSVQVWSQNTAGNKIGPDRFVYVLPNGVARVGQ